METNENRKKESIKNTFRNSWVRANIFISQHNATDIVFTQNVEVNDTIVATEVYK